MPCRACPTSSLPFQLEFHPSTCACTCTHLDEPLSPSALRLGIYPVSHYRYQITSSSIVEGTSGKSNRPQPYRPLICPPSSPKQSDVNKPTSWHSSQNKGARNQAALSDNLPACSSQAIQQARLYGPHTVAQNKAPAISQSDHRPTAEDSYNHA